MNEDVNIESSEAAVVESTTAAKRCVAKPNGLPRSERLRGHNTVSRLFAQGDGGFVFPIKYICSEAVDASAPTALLFTVPKRFHKRANRRNLLRRRMKEAYRLQKGLLGDKAHGLNIALIYSHKEPLEYLDIAKAIEKILSRIRS